MIVEKLRIFRGRDRRDREDSLQTIREMSFAHLCHVPHIVAYHNPQVFWGVVLLNFVHRDEIFNASSSWLLIQAYGL